MALSTTQYGYIIDPMVPFTDDKGKTIKNGFVRIFVAGSSTPVVTYRNFDGATNQDRIELDNSGRTRTSVIGSKGLTYKVCVYDKHHSQESPILTVDKVSAIGANITAGAGSTLVTGLDGLTTKPDGFVDASVVGTDGYVALDHTLVTDDLDTDAKVTAVEDDRYIPLLNEDVNDPDSKMTLGRLWQWVLGKIKSLSTTITAFRAGDVIPVDGPSGTAKMSKDDLLKETAENAVNSGVAASRVNANNVELSDMGKANKIVSLAFDFGDWELGSASSSGSDIASTIRIRTALMPVGATSKHIFINIPSGYYLFMACTNTSYKIDWTNGEGVEFTLPPNQSVRFVLKKSDDSDLSLELPNLVFAKSGVNCVGDDVKDLSDVLQISESAKTIAEQNQSSKADKYVYKVFDFGTWELGAVSSSGDPIASTTRIRTALIAVGASSKHIFVNIPSGYYMMMACTNTAYKVDWSTGNNKEFILPPNQSVRFAIKKSDESDLTYDTPNNIFNSSGIACVGDKTYNLSDVLKMVEAATGKEIINPVAADSSLLSDIVFKRAKTWRYVNALQKRCYSLHTKNLGAKYHLSNEFLLHSYSSGNSFSINSDGEAVITSASANAESSLHIGCFNPYYFYELDCDFGAGKTAGVEFPNEDFSDVIRVTCEGTAVRVVRIVSGVETELATFTASETPERLYVHYNGLNVNISVGYGNTFAYLGYTACDMRAFADYKSRRFGVYAKLDVSESITIKDVWGGISSGTGQADPVVCHRKNGEPYVKNGKLYLTMTFRGYEEPIMSGACICTLDIDTYELEIVGHLYGVTAGDKLYHMTNSCFLYNDDENAFYFFGLIFDLNNHYEYYAKLEEQDIGSSLYLQYTNLGLGVNKESFDVVYDATLKTWTALYCDLADDYKTKLAYANELLGTYVVQASTTATNTTASRWVVVGSTKKAVMGGDLQTMAIYDDQLTYEGEMNVPEKLNGNRMWCTVIPVRVGNFTKYLMLSFDRGNFSGSYSYGTSGVFESDIIKKGSEYEYIG